MEIHELIVPLGVATYVGLFLTVVSGFLIFKFHVKWIKMKLHIWLGIITVVLATAHAGVVIYLNH